jgi:hypothetical protein
MRRPKKRRSFQTDEERRAGLDEILAEWKSSKIPPTPAMPSLRRSRGSVADPDVKIEDDFQKLPKKQRRPMLFTRWDLVRFLLNHWLGTLTPIAWKIVCYTAARQLELTDIPKRERWAAPPMQALPAAVAISLRQFRLGVKFRHSGTNLAKSSIAKGVNEAIAAGILVRERRNGPGGDDIASHYHIDWMCVRRGPGQTSR